ncbi:MAG TPA: DUF3570 domain-containing protein [Fibrobacteria bacterium]|nr:DUF3570 domain-containing protein [Fibrobacteria bacterium]
MRVRACAFAAIAFLAIQIPRGEAVLPAAQAAARIAPRPPGRVEGRVHSYQDDNRLYVTSASAGLEHPLFAGLSLRARAVADWIAIAAGENAAAPADPHAGHAGHEHAEEDDNPILADAVSGASARISSASANSRETRVEGVLGLALRKRLGNTPVTFTAEARASHEPDYSSWAGTLAGQADLFRGNATVTAFLGAGRDEISPAVAPAGQAGGWPAAQSKVSGGFSLAQSATPRLLLSAGASAALQTGRLSSPYRNSLVGITYFPERLPGERLRGTAFLQASWYLGRGTALHVRQGAYADDWGVTAWIPETALAREFGPRTLATLKHRFYAQSPADFHRTVYPDRRGFRSGDLRLGTLYDQTGAALLEYRVVPGTGAGGPVVLALEYAFSRLEYPDLGARALLSHILSAGVRAEY